MSKATRNSSRFILLDFWFFFEQNEITLRFIYKL